MAFKAGAIYGQAVLDDKKWTAGLKSLGKATAAAGAAIAAAFSAAMVASIKKAEEFQKSMANVSTLIDTTAISVQDLTKSVLQMDPALGSATDLTNGLYQAFSAGATTAEEAMQVTTDSAMFAKAALTDTNTAVDVLTTAVNAYGKETVSTTKASDIFFQTIKFGKTTGAELAATIGDSIPLFASSGIAIEELGAGLAAMTKQGVNSANATTQLNAIVSSFLKPSESMAELLQKVGYESGSAFLKAEGLSGALKLVEEETKGDAAAMSELLPNIRALRGAMALTGVGGEEFKSVLNEMANASGVTAEAFEKQELTMETLRNSMEKNMIVLGNIGKFFVDQVAVGATKAANGVLQFLMSTEGMNIIADIIANVSAAWEALKTILEPIVNVILENARNIIAQVKDRFAELFPEMDAGAGSMKVMSIVSNLVSSALNILGKVIKTQIDAIFDFIQAIQASVKTVGTFFDFLKGNATWEEVKQEARTAGQAFVGFGKNYVENLGEVFQTARDEVRTFGGETEELTVKLTANVETAYNRTKNYVVSNWGEMLTGQENAVNAMGDNLLGLPQYAATAYDEIENETENTTATVINSWEDAAAAASIIYGEMAGAYSGLSDNINSQTQDDAEEFVFTWKGAFDTISSYASGLFNALGNVSKAYFETQLSNENLSAAETEKIKKKQFAAEKRNKIAGVWMSAGQSIMGWWEAAPKLGPIAGPIFAGIMTGITAGAAIAQSVLIGQQQYVPSKQRGGMASGLTRINEQGGEIVSLPDGSQVIPSDISRQIAAEASNNNVINVSFAGANISDDVSLDRIVEKVSQKLGRQMRLVG